MHFTLPQCLYKGALYLTSVPVQGCTLPYLSACTRVQFTFFTSLGNCDKRASSGLVASALNEQRDFHWLDSREMSYWGRSSKRVNTCQFGNKSDTTNTMHKKTCLHLILLNYYYSTCCQSPAIFLHTNNRFTTYFIFIVPCIVIFYGITNRCDNVQSVPGYAGRK